MNDKDEIAEAAERELDKRREDAKLKAPYPFCLHPEKCAGKGYCPRDIACNE